MQSHPDQRFASYIYSGLTSGFRIEAELEAGRVVGPIAHNLTDRLHSSPIGLVPKSNQVGKWRMIVDLSFPRGHSVNDGVSKELSSITYAWVEDAVTRILQLGRGTQLAKFDLKNAYHNLPIHPHDQHNHMTNTFWLFVGPTRRTSIVLCHLG